jgi:acyl-coenzyme A thioesterase PaaI-like protein
VSSLFSECPRRVVTIDLHVHYLDAVADEDVIAEARVRRQGKSIVFVEIDAQTNADGKSLTARCPANSLRMTPSGARSLID